MLPMWVRLGNVAANDKAVFCCAHEHRQVRSERSVVSGRDQDRKRIRVHKRNRVGMITHAEVFGDVHGILFRPFGAWFTICWAFPRLKFALSLVEGPSAALFRRFAAQIGKCSGMYTAFSSAPSGLGSRFAGLSHG